MDVLTLLSDARFLDVGDYAIPGNSPLDQGVKMKKNSFEKFCEINLLNLLKKIFANFSAKIYFPQKILGTEIQKIQKYKRIKE